MNRENCRKMIFYIFVIALILWMGIIFSFSAQTAEESSGLSGEVGRRFSEIFVPKFEKWEEARQTQFVDRIDFWIRKTAHFMEYAVLGVLWMGCLCMKPEGKQNGKSESGLYREDAMWKKLWASIAASAVFAAGDEFHQLFVKGRAGRWMDVGIDTAGATAGVFIVWLMINIYRNRKRKKPAV